MAKIPAIGDRFEFHGEDLWECTRVIPHTSHGEAVYLIQAKNVKKNGTLGAYSLSYWSDKPGASSKIHVSRKK